MNLLGRALQFLLVPALELLILLHEFLELLPQVLCLLAWLGLHHRLHHRLLLLQSLYLLLKSLLLLAVRVDLLG